MILIAETMKELGEGTTSLKWKVLLPLWAKNVVRR